MRPVIAVVTGILLLAASCASGEAQPSPAKSAGTGVDVSDTVAKAATGNPVDHVDSGSLMLSQVLRRTEILAYGTVVDLRAHQALDSFGSAYEYETVTVQVESVVANHSGSIIDAGSIVEVAVLPVWTGTIDLVPSPDSKLIGMQVVPKGYLSDSGAAWAATFSATTRSKVGVAFDGASGPRFDRLLSSSMVTQGASDTLSYLVALSADAVAVETQGGTKDDISSLESLERIDGAPKPEDRWLEQNPATRSLSLSSVPLSLLDSYRGVGVDLQISGGTKGSIFVRSRDGVSVLFSASSGGTNPIILLHLPDEPLDIYYTTSAEPTEGDLNAAVLLGELKAVDGEVWIGVLKAGTSGVQLMKVDHRPPTLSELRLASSIGVGPTGLIDRVAVANSRTG